MGKVKYHLVDVKERNKIISELFEIIANLKNKEEVFVFLFGLFTRSEALMIARRIQIAKMLVNNKGYEEIRKKLKVSYQTINSIEQWLQSNQKRIDLITKDIKRNNKKGKNYEIRGENLLDKYAHHRFLKELLG